MDMDWRIKPFGHGLENKIKIILKETANVPKQIQNTLTKLKKFIKICTHTASKPGVQHTQTEYRNQIEVKCSGSVNDNVIRA